MKILRFTCASIAVGESLCLVIMMKMLLLLSMLIFLVGCDVEKESQQTEAQKFSREQKKVASSDVKDESNNSQELIKLKGDVTFTLEDGEAMNHQYPDTFEIPDRNRRENLKKGDIVKLMFTFTDGVESQTERMWVIVHDGDATGFKGILDNDPYCTDLIKSGLEVEFKPKNVISIYEETASE